MLGVNIIVRISMKNILLIIVFLIPIYCYPQTSTTDSIVKNTNITAKTDTINSSLFIKKAENNTKSKNDNNWQIQNTLLNGSILIIVALIGAILYRQTQFKTFLLQKRIEIYSFFLSEAEKCQRNVDTSILNTTMNKNEFDESKIPSIIAQLYWPMTISQFSVTLILDKKYRPKFKEIMKKLSEFTINRRNRKVF